MKSLHLPAIHASEERHDGCFHKRIRRLRLQQGMSQQEIADTAEISVRTYREWESGRTVPFPGKNLRRISTAYRVTPSFLLNGDEEGLDAFD